MYCVVGVCRWFGRVYITINSAGFDWQGVVESAGVLREIGPSLRT